MIANGRACLHELLRKTPMKNSNTEIVYDQCIDGFFSTIYDHKCV